MSESPARIDIEYAPDGRCVLRATWSGQLPEEQPRFAYQGPLSCVPALMHALAQEVGKHFGQQPRHHWIYSPVHSLPCRCQE